MSWRIEFQQIVVNLFFPVSKFKPVWLKHIQIFRRIRLVVPCTHQTNSFQPTKYKSAPITPLKTPASSLELLPHLMLWINWKTLSRPKTKTKPSTTSSPEVKKSSKDVKPKKTTKPPRPPMTTQLQLNSSTTPTKWTPSRTSPRPSLLRRHTGWLDHTQPILIKESRGTTTKTEFQSLWILWNPKANHLV